MGTATTQNSLEEKVWLTFKKGDKKAFEQLYQQYYPILLDYGIKLTGDKELVIDCIQDFFLYVWKHKEKLGAVRSLRYYFVISFRRRLFKELEKKRTQSYHHQAFLVPLGNQENSIEQEIIHSERDNARMSLAKAFLKQLSPRQREIVYLRYFSGLSPKEIASAMEINYQTVVNHLCEAFKSLRAKRQAIAGEMY